VWGLPHGYCIFWLDYRENSSVGLRDQKNLKGGEKDFPERTGSLRIETKKRIRPKYILFL